MPEDPRGWAKRLNLDGFAPVGALPEGQRRDLCLYPDPVLRRVTAPAGELTHAELCALAADLLATMYAENGRGLAAPQIGVSRSIFVMDADWKTGTPAPRVLLDPAIYPLKGPDAAPVAMVEGCLSLPDQPCDILRPAAVMVEAFTLDGRAISGVIDAIAARIIQHETDHLRGRLIIDYPSSAARAELQASP